MARRYLGRRVTSTPSIYILWPARYLLCHRYFGRAKDLPGVRELFQSHKTEVEEESQALHHYKKFMNQGPSYYGDADDTNETLLDYERAAEEEGKIINSGSSRSLH